MLEGHTESVFVELKKKASLDDVKAAWREFGKDMAELEAAVGAEAPHLRQRRSVPPAGPPRPRRGGRHVDGRRPPARAIRCWRNGVKYMLVSHNTRMGAARGAILVAEYLTKKGYIV